MSISDKPTGAASEKPAPTESGVWSKTTIAVMSAIATSVILGGLTVTGNFLTEGGLVRLLGGVTKSDLDAAKGELKSLPISRSDLVWSPVDKGGPNTGSDKNVVVTPQCGAGFHAVAIACGVASGAGHIQNIGPHGPNGFQCTYSNIQKGLNAQGQEVDFTAEGQALCLRVRD